ncbi:MAG TPA: biosynthetic peptidoglycan transglycosylase [Polyangiaceae bacterium]
MKGAQALRKAAALFRAFKVEARKWVQENQRLAAIGAAGLAVLLIGSFALGPIVRARVEKMARQRGISIEIGRVWPDFGGVRLKRVRFRSEPSGWLSGELARVDVRVGLGLGLRALRVRGGHVSVSGSTDEVVERLRTMRQGPASEAKPADDDASGPELLVEGLGITWTGAIDPSSTLEVENGRYERTSGDRASSQGLIGAGAIRANKGSVRGRARDLLARFVRQGKTTSWKEARLDALELEVPLSAGKAVAGAVTPAVDTAPAAARGYVEKAARLRDQLTQLAAWAAEHLAEGAPVEVNGLAVVLTQGDQTLNIGPGSLHVGHRSDALDLDFAPGQSDARAKSDPSGLSLHARIPTRPGEITVYVQGGPVTLASLGVHEHDFGLFDVGKAKLEAKGNVKLSADAQRLLFDGDGHLSSLSVVHQALAADPVRGLELAWRASGIAELDGTLLRIDEGKIELGAIRLEAYGAIEQGKDFVRIQGRANVPISDCQKMFDSLPPALVPKLAGMTMSGSFSLYTGFALDTRRPDDIQIDWDLKNHCRIMSVPPDIDVARFSRPFRRIAYDEHGQKVEMVSGPGTPDWVPLLAISPFMEVAVTTTEDGGFRYHGGFDKGAIKNSIRDNLRVGRFMRGASTITMQLAKNLYLEREKNLSRKLQEAVLTTYLEQALTKDEILELYFNIVEFGPMIYGIGPAAEHYFSASANDLSLGQSLFLTSILPNPKRTYFAPTGQVSKGWLGYLHRVMKIMRDKKKINDEEFLDGISEVITRGVARSPRVRPSSDIQRELGGDLPWMAPEGP